MRAKLPVFIHSAFDIDERWRLTGYRAGCALCGSECCIGLHAASGVAKRPARERARILLSSWDLGEERGSRDQCICYIVCWWCKVQASLKGRILGEIKNEFLCPMQIRGDDGPKFWPTADCSEQRKYWFQMLRWRNFAARKCQKDGLICLPVSVLSGET